MTNHINSLIEFDNKLENEKTELSLHSYQKDEDKCAFDFIGEKCKLELNIDASNQSISKVNNLDRIQSN